MIPQVSLSWLVSVKWIRYETSYVRARGKIEDQEMMMKYDVYVG
jgi:hypothetical protein